MKKYFFLFFALTVLFSACDSESQMNRTVFVPDENDSNLPAYTEWGYNSFGAVYDGRSYFLATNDIVPCKILYKDGILRFALFGIIRANYEPENVTLLIDFPFESTEQYADLLKFNDLKIDLSADDCIVKIIYDEKEKEPDITSGALHFKRAQLLYIDNVPNRVILSGTFEMSFFENDFPIRISDGRFDLGITDNEFHSYNQ
jgi:hypothetical protein